MNKILIGLFNIIMISLIIEGCGGGNQHNSLQQNANHENKERLEGTVTDIDGNIYKTIKIGNQEWMAENLKVIRFQNGDPIYQAKSEDDWYNYGSGPVWCIYENNDEYGKKYGRIYNWAAVTDSRGLAPEGWRIPNDADWDALADFLGGFKIAGIKLKSTTDWNDYRGGTNESGFNGLPGGRKAINNTFYDMGNAAYFYSSSNDRIGQGFKEYCLLRGNNLLNIGYGNANFDARYVRCIKMTSEELQASKELKEKENYKVVTEETPEYITDIDGNKYKKVKIGDQVWMAENLKTTKLNNGTEIHLASKNDFWQEMPNYCWYDFDIQNKSTYGALYGGYTIITNKLCPAGWHVPSISEWQKLIMYLDSEYDPNSIMKITNAGRKMKTVDGWEFAVEATNESGFSALPGGFRSYADMGGVFSQLFYEANWWSSSIVNDTHLFYILIQGTADDVIISDQNLQYGYSVRCIKDQVN
ncbi:MAG TPA: FISUMP domain-containing protein [Bacteroidales bacterium]|nr:FISUMP domain-containing protein [Bacteroidales bacterium]